MKITNLVPALALLGGALLVGSCTTATPTTIDSGAAQGPVWSQLSEFIRADMDRNGIKGLSIAVSTSKGTLWSAGFGLADPAARRPFTPDLISNEGSVSKLITATAIMKLVEDGKVDLDAPVSRYLADFQPQTRFVTARAITVRDLMTHHSGLPSDYLQGFMPGDVKPPQYPDPFAGNAARVSTLYVATPPGTAFSYSNIGVSLLGLIVEKTSGQSFEAFCQARVLGPLGMKDSSLLVPDGFETNPRYARGTSGGKNAAIPYIRDLPAGSLNSTARDMARFASSYLATYRGDPGILSQASVKQMFSVQNPGVEADVGFQIGLNFWLIPLEQLPGEVVVGHGGDLDPFHALLLLMPERDLAVNIQVNSIDGIGSFNLADIAAQALKAGVTATGQAPVRPTQPKAAPVTPTASQVAQWTGDYSSPLGVLRVQPQGSGVKLWMMGLWVDGVPRADGTIGLEMKILGLKVPVAILETITMKPTAVNGTPAVAVLIGSMPYGAALKVSPEPVSAAWKARAGTYRVVNPTPGDVADQAKVYVDGETGLFMFGVRAFGQTVSLPLHILSDSQAVTQGYGRNLGETLSAEGSTLHFGGLTFTRE